MRTVLLTCVAAIAIASLADAQPRRLTDGQLAGIEAGRSPVRGEATEGTMKAQVDSAIGAAFKDGNIGVGNAGSHNIGVGNSGHNNIGSYNGGHGNIGTHNGQNNADSSSGNNNIGTDNGNNNGGKNDGNGNIGTDNGNNNGNGNSP
jgi:hypothetical protein